MDTLVKSVTIVHQASQNTIYKKVDILIENGIISKIGQNLSIKKTDNVVSRQ
jgi:dihydroorotase-like cyclic amidohydrolase